MNVRAWMIVMARPSRRTRTLPLRMARSARWAGTLESTNTGVMNETRNSDGLSMGGGGHVTPDWNRRYTYDRNRMKKNVASVKISRTIPQKACDFPSSAPFG